MMHWESDRASLLVSDYLRGMPRCRGRWEPNLLVRGGRKVAEGAAARMDLVPHGAVVERLRRTAESPIWTGVGGTLARGRAWAGGADGEGSRLDARRGGAGEGRPDNRGE